MIAVIISIYHSIRPLKKTGISVLRSVLIFMMPCIFLSILIGFKRLKSEIHTKNALKARSMQQWDSVISEIDKGYSDFAMLDPTATPLKWYRGEANFMLNNLDDALIDYKNAYKSHPYNIYVLNNLGTAYVIRGDFSEAAFYYEKALQIYPEWDEARMNLAVSLYNSGELEKASQILVKCQDKSNERYRIINQSLESSLP